MNAGERALCVTLSHFLRAQRVLASLSLVITVASLLLLTVLLSMQALSLIPSILLMVILLLGLLERYYALRLHFDSSLFRELASTASDYNLEQLDIALTTLRLRKPSASPSSLSERVVGTRRLISWHTRCVVLQVGLLLGFLLIAGV